MDRTVRSPDHWDGYCFKLTDCSGTSGIGVLPTHWIPGQPRSVHDALSFVRRVKRDRALLCSCFCLHAYRSSYQARLFDDSHGGYIARGRSKLWIARYKHLLEDDGSKIGVYTLQLLYPIPIPRINMRRLASMLGIVVSRGWYSDDIASAIQESGVSAKKLDSLLGKVKIDVNRVNRIEKEYLKSLKKEKRG